MRFELSMVPVTEGKITVKCVTEIQGNSILLRVSARFELSGVDCIQKINVFLPVTGQYFDFPFIVVF